MTALLASSFARFRAFAIHLSSSVVVLLVYAYRLTLGPWLGGHCRFHPSCSQYMLDAVRRHGPWRGTWRGVRRIMRCHPWGGGGYDPA